MKIAIIKYNAGNIRSVQYALERLGYQAQITADHQTIRDADKVIFPGVGEAAGTMAFLKKMELDRLILSLRQPVLGICLGMQLMCSHSEEGNTTCLGIFDEPVKKFILPADNALNFKIPHMGWNSLEAVQPPLFDPSPEEAYVYFVHSYYVAAGPHSSALSHYIHPFSAALQKNNFFATQFHPEKSGKAGEQILKNFLAL